MNTPLQTPPIYTESVGRPGTNWGAIWGGVFVFAAIWTVFEALAIALFEGANGLASLGAGMGVGMAVWTVVLTIIAMYVAGRETGQRAGVVARHDGLMHGMMMFGLSVVSVIVLCILSGAVFAAGSATSVTVHSGFVMSEGAAWTAFIALLLGWLAAMGGASTGQTQEIARTGQPIQMRPAA